MASKEPKEDPVLQRLDVLIRLQARIAVSPIPEQKDKVLFLSGAGFGPTAISELLGVSIEAVKSVLKRARKTAQAKASDANGEGE